MKKGTAILFAAMFFTMTACTDQKTEVTKEVIVTPAEKPVVVERKDPAKPTSISVDKNGVQVQTKKVDVKVGN